MEIHPRDARCPGVWASDASHADRQTCCLLNQPNATLGQDLDSQVSTPILGKFNDLLIPSSDGNRSLKSPTQYLCPSLRATTRHPLFIAETIDAGPFRAEPM